MTDRWDLITRDGNGHEARFDYSTRSSAMSRGRQLVERGSIASWHVKPCAGPGSMVGSHIEDTSVIDSDLFLEDPELARKLWADGFRPIHAEDVKPNDLIAYVQTMFGLILDGEVQTDRVSTVTRLDSGSILVMHAGTSTEADEHGQVWVKR